jgi:mono/diheme cytochrome c family protein
MTAIVLAATVRAAAPPADSSPSFEKDVRPIVLENCITCHNPEKKKGDLDLTRFKTAQNALEDEAIWEGVAQKLRAGQMPPKRAERKLNVEDKKKILAWVSAHVESGENDCEKIATDRNNRFYRGYVMSRRLTRFEYNNTIRDLMGVDLHLDELLPADGAGGEGFDTNGNALFISAISLEKYLQAADKALRSVLPDEKAQLPENIRTARRRILIVSPDSETSVRDAAREDLVAFASRAFRRAADNAEVERLLALFDHALARGDSFEASLRYALKAALVSPSFLFLVEPMPRQDGVYELGDYQIASRLSYFIWSSMPDHELFSLAARGQLHDPMVLRQQVLRMLSDPKSIALAQNFAPQWLGITALGSSSRPDSARFPEFDDALAEAERDEVVRFFDSIVREDRSLLDLIDADYTFVNEKLAALYDIPDVKGSQPCRIQLTDRNRGGVLGMAAVLTTTSYPLRTSPVLRGKFVIEQLLGERIPPPPPQTPQLPPDDRRRGGLTFRQQLDQHRANPECAACHSRMDPLGFGLENFDAIGRWRTTQEKDTIDSSGVLPNGERFSGPRELKQVLLRRKKDFLRNFSRKMLGYALGRELNKFDECVLADATNALAGSDNRPSALIQTIVLSKPFLYRYATK